MRQKGFVAGVKYFEFLRFINLHLALREKIQIFVQMFLESLRIAKYKFWWFFVVFLGLSDKKLKNFVICGKIFKLVKFLGYILKKSKCSFRIFSFEVVCKLLLKTKRELRRKRARFDLYTVKSGAHLSKRRQRFVGVKQKDLKSITWPQKLSYADPKSLLKRLNARKVCSVSRDGKFKKSSEFTSKPKSKTVIKGGGTAASGISKSLSSTKVDLAKKINLKNVDTINEDVGGKQKQRVFVKDNKLNTEGVVGGFASKNVDVVKVGTAGGSNLETAAGAAFTLKQTSKRATKNVVLSKVDVAKVEIGCNAGNGVNSSKKKVIGLSGEDVFKKDSGFVSKLNSKSIIPTKEGVIASNIYESLRNADAGNSVVGGGKQKQRSFVKNNKLNTEGAVKNITLKKAGAAKVDAVKGTNLGTGGVAAKSKQASTYFAKKAALNKVDVTKVEVGRNINLAGANVGKRVDFRKTEIIGLDMIDKFKRGNDFMSKSSLKGVTVSGVSGSLGSTKVGFVKENTSKKPDVVKGAAGSDLRLKAPGGKRTRRGGKQRKQRAFVKNNKLNAEGVVKGITLKKADVSKVSAIKGSNLEVAGAASNSNQAPADLVKNNVLKKGDVGKKANFSKTETTGLGGYNDLTLKALEGRIKAKQQIIVKDGSLNAADAIKLSQKGEKAVKGFVLNKIGATKLGVAGSANLCKISVDANSIISRKVAENQDSVTKNKRVAVSKTKVRKLKYAGSAIEHIWDALAERGAITQGAEVDRVAVDAAEYKARVIANEKTGAFSLTKGVDKQSGGLDKVIDIITKSGSNKNTGAGLVLNTVQEKK